MKLNQYEYQQKEMKKASAESHVLQEALVSISRCVIAGMKCLPHSKKELTADLESALIELEDAVDEVFLVQFPIKNTALSMEILQGMHKERAWFAFMLTLGICPKG